MLARLIALDIDGTLIAPGLGHEALPGPEIVRVVRGLVDAGVVVVLASGRMFPGTQKVAAHLGLATPLICQQGASVHRPDGAIIHRSAIDNDIAHELVAYARVNDWPFAWFDGVRYLASSDNPASRDYAKVSGIQAEIDPAADRSDIEPTGIDIISDRDNAPRIHRELAARYAERLHLLDFPGVTAAHAPDASKGNALARLARELGIRRDEVVAIGDSVNDVSMLRWAGFGASPAHADDYAREATDELLDGAGVDGVAQLLERLLRSAAHR